MFFIHFQDITLAMRIYPVSLGTLQINMEGTQITPSGQQFVNHKLLSRAGFELITHRAIVLS